MVHTYAYIDANEFIRNICSLIERVNLLAICFETDILSCFV